MARRKQKNASSIVATVTGKITVAPKRIKCQTDKVMVVATMQVQSEKRSDYPLRVVGFDEMALSVMLLRKGQVITVMGKSSYWQGYQLAVSSIAQ
ncbi:MULTISPECIES: hypothetical protein [Xenorhabdus]|uniref:Uncharacterized protein n=1 Tax=Xenorhabdus ehlersii TaxID=290111 RepID=A0A2D0IWN6_9GAMM|nr:MULTISPECIES: hypothetical protein [Xenorhabdus]MBC8950331.1 hypothetical protein [Xenorhabdus sp. TS4]PHM26353.1 hypothetical protein Xehl_00685 [Xenorhabdus ehlersii]RKE91599.1 hypothetical protein BDE27_1858 [Xenorhabdus ehlersii]